MRGNLIREGVKCYFRNEKLIYNCFKEGETSFGYKTINRNANKNKTVEKILKNAKNK